MKSLQSMTGFGQAEHSESDWRCWVELRSLNSRFLDVRIKLPPPLSHWNEACKKKIQETYARGMVECSVKLAHTKGENLFFFPQKALLRRCAELAKECRKKDIPLQLDLADIQTLAADQLQPFFSNKQEKKEAEDVLLHTLNLGLQQLTKQRKKEGRKLGEEMQEGLSLLTSKLEKARVLVQNSSQKHLRRLEKTTATLLKELSLEESSDLRWEIAQTAEKYDVSEEISRLLLHLQHAHELLESETLLGRKFEFLCQEILRELNTLSAKNASVEVSHLVVDMKSELEKLREQAQNIE